LCSPFLGYNTTNWVWTPALPGLDFSKIRELVVELAPTDLWSFWDGANTALKDLCEQQLVSRGPIKRLRIEVKATHWRNHPRLGTWTAGDFVPRRTDVAARDFRNVLRLFKEAVSSAGHCDICLPFWMQRSTVSGLIAEDWTKLGARIWFMPAPGPATCKAGEVGGVEWAEMAPLPDNFLP